MTDIRGYEFYKTTGLPVSGATVEYWDAVDGTPGGAATGSTTTTANGRWEFATVTDSPKDIKVSFTGSVRWYKGLKKDTFEKLLVNGQAIFENGIAVLAGGIVSTDISDPAAPGAGKVVLYSKSGFPYVRQGAAGAGLRLPPVQVVRKASDESVTSSTVLQNDDVLLFPILAAEVWAWELHLFVTGIDTGDIQAAFTIPTGATMQWGGIGPSSALGAGAAAGDGNFISETASGQGRAWGLSVVGGTAGIYIVIHGTVVNGANAGNVQLQWAQNISSGTATIVKAGSYLIATRLS